MRAREPTGEGFLMGTKKEEKEGAVSCLQASWKGPEGLVGRERWAKTRYTQGTFGSPGHTAHTWARIAVGSPQGAQGAECEMVRELPWARAGQKSWRPCFLIVPSRDRMRPGAMPLRTLPPGCAYRKGLGTEAPADSSGSALSPGSSLHPDRTTPEPAPGSPGTTSKVGTATRQVGFAPLTCPSVLRTAPSCSAPVLPGEAAGVQGREPGAGQSPG